MLTIFVSRRKQWIITADGSRMKVCRAYVRQNKKLRFLQELESFEKISSIRIVVKECCRLKRLPRHERTERAVIRFLHEYHAKQNMRLDCYAFANMVHGVEDHPCRYLYRYWNTRSYDGNVTVGDTIFLITPGEKVGSFHHAAIYVGQGLYISVYGAGGDLEIATLGDMKKCYKAKQVLVGTSKT